MSSRAENDGQRLAALFGGDREALIFHRSSLGIVHYDAELKLIDCNASFVRILASSRERLIGLDLRRLRDDRALEALEAPFTGCEGHYDGPYLPTTGGGRVWISMRTVPLEGDEGTVGGLAIVEDITRRWRAESLQRFALGLSDAAHDAKGVGDLLEALRQLIERLIRCEALVLGLVDGEGHHQVFAAGAVAPEAAGAWLEAERDRKAGVVVAFAPSAIDPDFFYGFPDPSPGAWLITLDCFEDQDVAIAVFSSDPAADQELTEVATLRLLSCEIGSAIERVQQRRQIRHIAFHDQLTGLPNRRALEADAHRGLADTTLVYLDFDRFKQINDAFGHQLGDGLLVQIAGRLRSSAGSTSLYRLGGDEFVALLRGQDRALTEAFTAALLGTLERPFELAGHRFQVGGSIGIAELGERAANLSELLKVADIAMYRAKVKGGGWAWFDDTADHDEDNERLDAALASALDEGSLEVVYQPIIELDSGRVCGVEALVRWPGTGLEARAVVAVAERCRLAQRLDDWVLRRALAQSSGFLEGGGWLAVNLSPQSVLDAQLTERLSSALAGAAVEPARLCLEITEAVTLGEEAGCAARLGELVDLGVSLALDDFGSGIASLSRVGRLPLHRLKIDRELVCGVNDQPRTHALVEVCVLLGHGLGLEVIAEGIEDGDQLAEIRRLGCTLGQGHHFAPAIAWAELESYLEK